MWWNNIKTAGDGKQEPRARDRRPLIMRRDNIRQTLVWMCELTIRGFNLILSWAFQKSTRTTENSTWSEFIFSSYPCPKRWCLLIAGATEKFLTLYTIVLMLVHSTGFIYPLSHDSGLFFFILHHFILFFPPLVPFSLCLCLCVCVFHFCFLAPSVPLACSLIFPGSKPLKPI